MLLYLFQETSQSPISAPSSLTDPITISTIVIMVCTVFYSVLTYFMFRETARNTRITSEIFEASHRPYLGISSVVCTLTPEKQEMVFSMPLINTGSVPANNVRRDLLILLDSVHLPMDTLDVHGQCVMPHSNSEHSIILSGDKFIKATSASMINLRLTFHYNGVEQKQYDYEMECVYYKSKNVLGITKTKST